jgi:hypothetical protein
MSTVEAVADAPVSEKTLVECLIHVRFNPNGTIGEIGECPAGVSLQNWFKFLSKNTLNCYQALAGGRGLFKLPRTHVDSLKAAASAEYGS